MKELVRAKKILIILDTHGKTPPFVESFEYFFEVPFNEKEVIKFLVSKIKKSRFIVKDIVIGKTRMVSSGRIWSRRKIEQDIIDS